MASGLRLESEHRDALRNSNCPRTVPISDSTDPISGYDFTENTVISSEAFSALFPSICCVQRPLYSSKAS
jgi:hypothetical protein